MPDYQQTQDFLYSLKNQGSKYGVDRMRDFVALLKHPERTFPIIHVAGTNGKGSVCAMLEAIYRANGYRTGLFTSPHLVHQGERVQVNREILSKDEIVRYTELLRPLAKQQAAADPDNHPSFFEFMAAMALLHFSQAKVDIVLLETGLGGRLDATNVVDPELSIITSIGLDHTDLLGDSIEAIAGEKAGIIKAGKPVLIGKLPAAAEKIIRQIADERGCQLYSVLDRFTHIDALPTTNLAGSFQRWNAAVAIYASEILAARFPLQTTDALQQIDWPGRWQTLQLQDRRLILDATHNAEGAAMLLENLQQLVQREGRKPIIVAGTLGEDRAASIMQSIAPQARELYLIKPNQSRATPTQLLESCLPAERDFPVFHSQLETIIPRPQTCSVGQPGDTIVITGSLYLIGEVLERLTTHVPTELGNLQDLP